MRYLLGADQNTGTIYLSTCNPFLQSSLAENQVTAGMLKYFAQICLQIITYFPERRKRRKKATPFGHLFGNKEIFL